MQGVPVVQLAEYARAFEKHKVDFEVLGDMTYDDLKEMGISEIGPRRKIFREITCWREDRDAKKADSIRAKMWSLEQQAFEKTSQANIFQRLDSIQAELGVKR